MENNSKSASYIKERLNKLFVLNGFTTAILIVVLFVAIFIGLIISQKIAITGTVPEGNDKEPVEIAKLKAEIEQIRSDTSGSLFWLKLIAVFVTVGGAVGGYLLAQTKASRDRIEFEDRKNVDAAYQSIIQELSNSSPLLRAAAVVKLGAILQSFPVEWKAAEDRKRQLKQLTKQVLAAALATEENKKVLKTITIAIALDKSPSADESKKGKLIADLKELDLSTVRAADAYWADVDFSYTDFFKAKLFETSFRRSILSGAQFRQADLRNAVLAESTGSRTSFKLADLRNASFSGAKLSKADFDQAKIYGVNIAKADFEEIDRNLKVDNSPNGDGSEWITVGEWLDGGKKQPSV